MSATDHLAPKQLAMFMPVGKILETHDLADLSHGVQSPANKERLMRSNVRQSAREGQDFSGGIHTPITVYHGPDDTVEQTSDSVVWDGHHRLAHAWKKGPRTEVPMEHIDASNWM